MPPKRKMNLKMHHRHHHNHHNRVKNDTKTPRSLQPPNWDRMFKKLPGSTPALGWVTVGWIFPLLLLMVQNFTSVRLVVEIPSFARFYKHIPGDTARFRKTINCTKKATGVYIILRFLVTVTLNLKRLETYPRSDGVSHTPFFSGVHMPCQSRTRNCSFACRYHYL